MASIRFDFPAAWRAARQTSARQAVLCFGTGGRTCAVGTDDRGEVEERADGLASGVRLEVVDLDPVDASPRATR